MKIVEYRHNVEFTKLNRISLSRLKTGNVSPGGTIPNIMTEKKIMQKRINNLKKYK
jgi:hypothetical protein